MKTAIIGGGKGCRAIIELARGRFLRELPLEVVCVADPDAQAPGILHAAAIGIDTTLDPMAALRIPDIELVIELTGLDHVLQEIHRQLPAGVSLIDHSTAHIFWDLARARENEHMRVKQLEEMDDRLSRERRFLQDVVDNIPDLLLVLDADRRIIRTNESFRRFVNLPIEDCIGRTCTELLVGTEVSPLAHRTSEALDHVFSTGEASSEVLITPPPNEAHWEVTRTPFKNERGQVETVLCTWHRITEKVLLQREVESAEQRLRSLIFSAQDWISMKDLEGRYLLVNPVCARALGRSPEEFEGKLAEEILDPEMATLVTRHDREVIESNRYRSYDEIYILDGRDHHFQTIRFPLKDYKGSTIGVCTIARDVSSERELGDQLVQAEKLAAVGKLAAGVAHEINNPLTGVLAFAEDLAEELADNEELRNDVEVIIRETLRCRNIVRNLLDFSRQDAPKLERIDPNDVVHQGVSLVKKLPDFLNVNIKWTPATGIPKIRGDIRQLQQVLLNLMLNAADAMEGKGTIRLGVEYERRDNRCVICVSDSGPGIPENLIDKIFEPFFSTKNTNGLGLAVSWGIVERHHGVMEVDMADDGGAVFRIVIPAAEEKP